MNYFTVLFFVMVSVLLFFLVFQAVNLWRLKGQARSSAQASGTDAVVKERIRRSI
jgi:hypothetical protein